MKATYRVLAILIPVLVALQTAFIAIAVFGVLGWVDDGHSLTKDVDDASVTGSIGFALHGVGAIATALVALLLLVVAFFAKIPGGVRSAALVLGAVVLQWILAFASFGAWPVGALHGLNAFLVFGLGMMAAQRATRSMQGDPQRTAAERV
jgi:hypothetical protein